MFRLALKQVRHNPKRLILTALAVALGVSLVTASMTFTNALNAGFTSLFKEIYSSQDIVIEADPAVSTENQDPWTQGRGIFTADDIEAIRGVDGVVAAGGSVQVSATVLPQGATDPMQSGGAPTQIFNWTGTPELDAVTLIDGRGIENTGEILIDIDGIKRLGYEIGDTVTMYSQIGADTFEIVGTVRFGESNELRGASLMFLHADDAHRIAEDPNFGSAVAITAEGADNDAIATAIQEVLPEGTRAISAEQKANEQIEALGDIMQVIDIIAIVFGLISLFVGGYLIVNTFRVIVTQRTREIGLQRAIGVSGKQIRTMILLEALVVAILASTLGIALGFLLALATAALLNSLGGAAIGTVTLPIDAVVASYSLGAFVTLVSALLPAIHASTISPMEALRESATGGKKPLSRRNLVGAIMVVLGIGAIIVGLYSSPVSPWMLVAPGAVLLVLGVTLLSAQILVPVANGLRKVLTKWFGVDGKLAANNIRREPRRSANTAAALMIGVMLLALISTFTQSIKGFVAETFNQSAADLYIFDGMGMVAPGAVEIIETVDGIDYLTRMGLSSARVDGEPEYIVALDADTAVETYPLDVEPALDQVGTGAFISPELYEAGFRVGDTITVAGSAGTVELTVTGRYLTRGDAALIVDWSTAETFVEDIDIAQVMVVVDEGVEAAEVQEAITEALKDSYPLVLAVEPSAMVQLVSMIIDLILAIITALLSAALVIAILGVANTLLLSVTERTREIGLLRAVGMNKRSVWRMITLESLVMAVFGTVVGMLLGVGLGAALVLALQEVFTMSVAIPWWVLLGYTVLAVIAGVLAAIWPAIRASRMNVLEAIAADG